MSKVNSEAPNNGGALSAGFGLVTVLALAASALLLISLKLPLWQMLLEAPQYREQEALKVAVHPNAFKGDLREINVLDQDIGVHVPKTLPQFAWLPGLLVAGAVAGGVAGFLPGKLRGRALFTTACLLALGLLCASIQALSQMHRIGHNRDHKTVLAGVKDFTPPFLVRAGLLSSL